LKQYQYEWRASHPLVNEILVEVDMPQRDGKRKEHTLKMENDIKRARVKKENRDAAVVEVDEHLRNGDADTEERDD